MMEVNAQVREGAKCKRGDVVSVVMELDEDTRAVDVPAYLKKMIEGDREAREFWPKVTFTHQMEYVGEIESAKRPETREHALQRWWMRCEIIAPRK